MRSTLLTAWRRWTGPRPEPEPGRGVRPAAAVSEGWSPRPGLVQFPRLERLRDAQVLPAEGAHVVMRLRPDNTFSGGPVWPSGFETNPVRFTSRRRFLDRLQAPVERCDEVIDRPAVWAGYIQHHFGHMVAEHSGRLLWSRYMRPDDLFLFSADPGHGVDALPGWVIQVIEWFGIGRDRIHLVRRPTLVRELSVAPQAEPFKEGPTEAYLDLLDHHAASAGMPVTTRGAVYVGRMGMLGQALGGFAGEAYLAGLLEGAGVRVVDPARSSVREQLEAYAGARRLIFAEGSAVHGRQLLGRIDQDILILNRRPNGRLGRAVLPPRCRRLRYVEVTQGVAVPIGSDGTPRGGTALSVLDPGRLLKALAACGIDLAPAWDAVAFRRACERDMEVWRDIIGRSPRVFDAGATLAALDAVSSFTAAGPSARPAS